jgi:hypothetical protein
MWEVISSNGRGRAQGGICKTHAYYRWYVRMGIYPGYGLRWRLIITGDLFVRVNGYLQKFAVPVLNGKGYTFITMIVYGIFMRGKQVDKLPGCGMQCKHTQEYDSEYFM